MAILALEPGQVSTICGSGWLKTGVRIYGRDESVPLGSGWLKTGVRNSNGLPNYTVQPTATAVGTDSGASVSAVRGGGWLMIGVWNSKDLPKFTISDEQPTIIQTEDLPFADRF